MIEVLGVKARAPRRIDTSVVHGSVSLVTTTQKNTLHVTFVRHGME